MVWRPRPHQVHQQIGGLRQGAAAVPGLGVLQRRVPDHDLLGPGGRGVVVHRRDGEAGEARGQLPGVADGGRGEDEGGVGPVVGGQAAQAAQHQGDVAAEDAPVGVQFVHHHQAQVPQEAGPAGVAGEDADVEHVGVGEHRVGVAAHPGPGLLLGVAVVDRRHQFLQAQPVERGELVLGEGLGGEDQQGGGPAGRPAPPRPGAPGSRATCPRRSRRPPRCGCRPGSGRRPAPGGGRGG